MQRGGRGGQSCSAGSSSVHSLRAPSSSYKSLRPPTSNASSYHTLKAPTSPAPVAVSATNRQTERRSENNGMTRATAHMPPPRAPKRAAGQPQLSTKVFESVENRFRTANPTPPLAALRLLAMQGVGLMPPAWSRPRNLTPCHPGTVLYTDLCNQLLVRT